MKHHYSIFVLFWYVLITSAEKTVFKNCTNSDIKWGTDQGSPIVISMYPTCTKLELGNGKLHDAHAEALSNAFLMYGNSLTEIRLQRNFIGDDGIMALGRFLKHSSVSILHLSSNFISDEGALALAEAMKRDIKDEGAPLKELHLANNEIGETGCESLGHALRGNQYLKVLVLNHNPLEDDGVQTLALAARTSVLRDLKLTQCGLTDTGASLIGALLGYDNSLLQVVEIGLNNIGDVGALAVAKGLALNAHMKTMILTGAPTSMRGDDEDWKLISDIGAVAIAQALLSNKDSKLQVLDLSRGRIGDSGAKALGNMLLNDQHLQVLKLQDNLISDDGAVGLGLGTRGHGVLEELHLRSNNIHDEGASSLLHSLKRNPQIHQLVLHDNMVASSILERVREVLHLEPPIREQQAEKEKAIDATMVEIEVTDHAMDELLVNGSGGGIVV